MISLTCTSCKKSLEIDDAFAGGVCRCQFCGTIQTVPSTLKRASRPGGPAAAAAAGTTPAPQKALYQRKTATQVDAPSAAVAGNDQPQPSRAARAAHPVAPATTESKKNNNWLIGIAIGAGAALLIGIVAWLAL